MKVSDPEIPGGDKKIIIIIYVMEAIKVINRIKPNILRQFHLISFSFIKPPVLYLLYFYVDYIINFNLLELKVHSEII